MVKRFSMKLLGEVPQPIGIYFHNRPVLKSFIGISSKHRSGVPATRT